jgi:hypothetical protein
MNNVNNQLKRPKRNITWQAQPHPAHCDHELGHALKRCLKCGSLEAK